MERVYTTPLLDKLGIRPGMRVALIDIDDPEIRRLIAERTTDLTEGTPEPDTDVVLLGAETPAELAPARDAGHPHPPERRDLDRLAQGKGGHPALRRPPRRGEGRRPGRQQGRVVLRDAHGPAPGHPRRAPTEVSATVRSTALAHRALYHPRMPDSLLIILIVILIVVVMWRGPKTLPKLGEALGRGVKEAKTEATKAQAEIQARTSDDAPPTDTSGDRPA